MPKYRKDQGNKQKYTIICKGVLLCLYKAGKVKLIVCPSEFRRASRPGEVRQALHITWPHLTPRHTQCTIVFTVFEIKKHLDTLSKVTPTVLTNCRYVYTGTLSF